VARTEIDAINYFGEFRGENNTHPSERAAIVVPLIRSREVARCVLVSGLGEICWQQSVLLAFQCEEE
jgi:hypothetical protein